MKRKLLALGLVIAIMGSFAFGGGKASADSFSQNNVIDDGIFDNSQAMSADQIDNWLNTNFGSQSCISTSHGFSAPDPVGYNPSSGFIYGGNVSAGHVIADAASAYNLNPQVLLTTLQKEESLVGGGGSCGTLAYTAAMGFGCPDSGTTHSYSGVDLYAINGVNVTSVSGTCVNSASKAGFSQQVIYASWLLKFGEQRSEGNINWAIIKGNWNNSDDPQTCYGGPMTQGYRQVCPSGATTFYDGYDTIDSTAVHMDNGATATLYWYTPHLSGGRTFFNLFTGWFGSAHYKEPLSSLVVVGNQSDKIYYISLTNGTRYFVPTWSTMQAFGLDRYQIIPMDDSSINNYTDGGTLKTLVWNNDDQKIYLVDNGRRIWFQQYCGEWGLDCANSTAGDVTFMSSPYFDDILTYAGASTQIQKTGNAYYFMANGIKQPFASTPDMQILGYTDAQSVPIYQLDLNSPQSYGELKVAYPRFIQFTPSQQLLYFDGQNYRHVPSYDTYTQWGGGQIFNPPTSSYNTTLPSLASDLSVWVQSNDGNKYLVSGGRKVDISANTSNWYSGTFQAYADGILNSLPTVAQRTNLNVSGNIYVLQSGTVRHVPSYDDYLWLGIQPSNTMNFTPNPEILPEASDILRDGAFFTVQGNGGLYMTNGSGSLHIPSADMATTLGVNWPTVRYNLNPNVLSQAYPSGGDLSAWVKPNGSNLSYLAQNALLTINTAAAANWGIDTGTHTASTVDLAGLFGVKNSQALGQFVRDETTGGVYYASGGTYHYVASYATIVNLGGLNNPIPNVAPDFFTGLSQGPTMN